MQLHEYSLFPTRLLTIQFPDTDTLNGDLCRLFDERQEFADGFDMHPDSLNLLSLAEQEPAIARLRGMFLEGLERWLGAERVGKPESVDLVMFSNYAAKGELTLAHNHNADLVGIYYARTPLHDDPVVGQPDEKDDYFDVGDGLLILHDPRFNANLAATGQRDYVKIAPRPSLMLIFPAHVWHTVTPHRGEVKRLSFSMNFTLQWPGRSLPVRQSI
ncbi:MAG: putative 2OG-Fe(II) oxygenase [Gemmataceae bacterium]